MRGFFNYSNIHYQGEIKCGKFYNYIKFKLIERVIIYSILIIYNNMLFMHVIFFQTHTITVHKSYEPYRMRD